MDLPHGRTANKHYSFGKKKDREKFEDCKNVSKEIATLTKASEPRRSSESGSSSEEQETQMKPSFKIHGFWPSLTSRPIDVDEPEHCVGFRGDYVAEKVSKIQDINYYWPSTIWKHKTDGNHLFWEHEYRKHGRCASVHPKIRNMTGYFEKTLEIVRKLDKLQKKMQDHFPWINDETFVNFKDFENFIRDNAFGKNVAVHYEYVLGGTECWLESISFCYDLKFRPLDCVKSPFPKFDQILLPKPSDIYIPSGKWKARYKKYSRS